MERDFRYFRDKYGDAGARDAFEKICTQWLTSKYGADAHNIRVCQGDAGIDVLVGDFSTPISVFQCKYFIDGIEDTQKQQIRESYRTAISSAVFSVKNWHLCIPNNMSCSEFAWWSSWKSKTEKLDNIPLELCDGDYILGQLKHHGLYDGAFDVDIKTTLEEIRASLLAEKKSILEQIIAMPTTDELASYEGMVFVDMLQSANIRDIDGCKSDFFNAEYTLHTLQSQGVAENISAYKKLQSLVHSMWRTQYTKYQNESDGNELLSSVYERIEDRDKDTLMTIGTISLLAKKGMLHQLADECQVGWVKDYKTRLSDYLSERRRG